MYFFYFAVQDFLEKAKKEFEEQWSKNPKVSRMREQIKYNDKLTSLSRLYVLFGIKYIQF